ncbi:hypothetical protein KJ925_00175 [Patescibacteria group bacterium]|nr:hypothetical protein [Patescibacteria group bacterium]MBU2612862.1 hypothetical protein [Patescibacteria group bacterium]
MKTKKTVRRRVSKGASTPTPGGPTGGSMLSACGHSACSEECRVHYVGPVSHMRDHHILHVSRGMSHIWAASIIAGLAVVLTGAFAFSAAQAQTDAKIEDSRLSTKQSIIREIRQMRLEMEDLQTQVSKLNNALGIPNAE